MNERVLTSPLASGSKSSVRIMRVAMMSLGLVKDGRLSSSTCSGRSTRRDYPTSSRERVIHRFRSGADPDTHSTSGGDRHHLPSTEPGLSLVWPVGEVADDGVAGQRLTDLGERLGGNVLPNGVDQGQHRGHVVIYLGL